MATRQQLSQSAKTNYEGSYLHRLNSAKQRGATLNPVKITDKPVDRRGSFFLEKKQGRVTSISELCTGSEKVTELSGEYEPYLLIEDEYNLGEWSPIAIYDTPNAPTNDQKYFVDLHNGEVLLAGDVLVYWK